VVDEVEQDVVGPVQILEDEHERPVLGECLEEPPPCGEGLVAAIAARVGLARDADERAQVALDPGGAFGIGNEIRDHLVSFVSAATAESVSRMPACAFTISPTAQNATPSPYGNDRPCRQ
jgi:hypothetical protein